MNYEVLISALKLMWYGMSGIFIVMLTISFGVYLMSKIIKSNA